jgi:ABC-type multidrug transport system fused ATPase/permease subunit
MQDSVEETNPIVEVDTEKGVTDNDGSSKETVALTKKKTELLRKHTSMQSSVLRFKNVDFAVGSNENKKLILDNVSGTVKWGRVLAVCCSFESDVSMYV